MGLLIAAEESGNFLVSPALGLMIWTLLAFGITLFLLNKLAFPRIAEALDRREGELPQEDDRDRERDERPDHHAHARLDEEVSASRRYGLQGGHRATRGRTRSGRR